MQEITFIDDVDDTRRVGSKNTVSKAFDISLHVLMKGYITQWATYSNEEFKEGVSLTCDD